ncbi:dephospho-CoA kinase [Rhizomicrobium palustre]|uniref:Dephospho-CoA kinase n=2 Tax=Rhizomicrobium palustre TaxID=189966 RepID=A0A846MXQ9_9PROT|nr:dephospho-CoA kinase [Rhizomicrobium palustre]
MGKSETAKMFAALGIPVYDSDAAVHSLYAACGAAVEPIGKAFPGVVTEGRVDRAALSAALAKDPEGFARLEKIVHPLVAEKQRQFVAEAVAAKAEMVVLDIPLLFETGGDRRVDKVVVVSAPAEQQRARALARPGMTKEKFAQILARQMPDAEKRLLADYVVDTGQGLEHARGEVLKIVASLRQK